MTGAEVRARRLLLLFGCLALGIALVITVLVLAGLRPD